mmetsp:Transcript_42335/g.131710  ORF Transcript_42335/g.131710 Transcript_42335/m.131710 type:complete len:88 (+) Transcript_42335:49-312(+)
MIATLQVDVVVRGTVRDSPACVAEPNDPHEVAKALGIHVQLESELTLSIDEIVGRLHSRRQEVGVRFRAKHKSETEWYGKKHGLAQD